MKAIEWVLRIGVALMFSGHGWFALEGRENWIPYLTSFGFSSNSAEWMLPVIGVVDQFVALAVLLKFPIQITYWCVFWTVITALARPISGESWLEFVERGANMASALGLHLIWHSNRKNSQT